jgi:hypothetical protein
MRVPPDVYLDARRPVWLDAEMHGHVRYDPHSRLIEVSPSAVGIKDVLTEAMAR